MLPNLFPRLPHRLVPKRYEKMATIRIPTIRISQNIGDFYAGVIDALDLISTSKVDRIRMTDLKIPKYAGYQRALIPERVASIRDYLNTPRSTFPNAIILSLDSEYIVSWETIDDDLGLASLEIENAPGAAKIIDGQHRAAALDAAPEGSNVLVSFFIDLDMSRSAEIFAKINSTQKAVNPSIAFQLFGYAEDRSPQKTAHDIAVAVNTTEGSPFYRQLRMLGTKDDWAKGTLSQSTFAKQLMRLYTKDPNADENRLLRGEKLAQYSGYPLRDFFISGDDKSIMEIVWKFFFHIASVWEHQWFDNSGKSILLKTTGYAALIDVMRRWLLSDRGQEIMTDAGVLESFQRIQDEYRSEDKRFIRENYPAGNQGVQALRNSLLQDLMIYG